MITVLHQFRNDTNRKHHPLACTSNAISEKLISAACAQDT